MNEKAVFHDAGPLLRVIAARAELALAVAEASKVGYSEEIMRAMLFDDFGQARIYTDLGVQSVDEKPLTCEVTADADGGLVATCPQLGVVSQGETGEEAIDNLREAVTLFLEHADPAEIQGRRDRYASEVEASMRQCWADAWADFDAADEDDDDMLGRYGPDT